MVTVTLYKIHSGFVNKPASFELEAALANESNGDFAAQYALPAGYSVGENTIGSPMIFDPRGQGCELVEHTSGRPQLVSGLPTMPVLDAV